MTTRVTARNNESFVAKRTIRSQYGLLRLRARRGGSTAIEIARFVLLVSNVTDCGGGTDFGRRRECQTVAMKPPAGKSLISALPMLSVTAARGALVTYT